MSGITRKNQAGVSGLVGPVVDFQRFTATSGTWNKPDGVSVVWIECIGAGGGGGGGMGSGGSTRNAGGGGGGAFAWACFSAAALPATLAIVAGAGGNAGSAGSSGGAGGNGVAGSNSTVTDGTASKIILQAFGGGFGAGSTNGTYGGGGGGGGTGDTLVGTLLAQQKVMVATLDIQDSTAGKFTRRAWW
jgi:hypothetical protein